MVIRGCYFHSCACFGLKKQHMMSRIRSGLTVCLVILSLLHSVVNGFTTTPRVVRHAGLPPSILYAGKSKGEDNVISDFCIGTNTFWKGLVVKPVRDIVEVRPATIRSDSPIIDKHNSSGNTWCPATCLADHTRLCSDRFAMVRIL